MDRRLAKFHYCDHPVPDQSPFFLLHADDVSALHANGASQPGSSRQRMRAENKREKVSKQQPSEVSNFKIESAK